MAVDQVALDQMGLDQVVTNHKNILGKKPKSWTHYTKKGGLYKGVQNIKKLLYMIHSNTNWLQNSPIYYKYKLI